MEALSLPECKVLSFERDAERTAVLVLDVSVAVAGAATEQPKQHKGSAPKPLDRAARARGVDRRPRNHSGATPEVGLAWFEPTLDRPRALLRRASLS